MKTRDESGRITVTTDHEVLVEPVTVLWDMELKYDDRLYTIENPNSWDGKFIPPPAEWFRVVHVFLEGDGSGLQGWSWLGHPLFCLIEIPATSVVAEFRTRLFDIDEPVYGRSLTDFYGMKRELVHGKVIADIFEGFIRDVRKAQ